MPRPDDRARRIYIGNLPTDVREDDVKDKFKKYGHIEFIDLKSRGGGPPFAFMDFEDPRDAEDAVRARDGYSWDGFRLRVEFPRGVGPRGAGGVPVAELERGGGRGRDSGRGGDRGDPRGAQQPRRSRYRVYISGLPPTGSWQDLKDHLRNAGEICYADVFRDGTGVVEFARLDDMKTALRKFDDTKFRSHGGETSYIRLKEDSEGGREGGSRSRSTSRTPPRRDRRSPSYGRGEERRSGGDRRRRDSSRSRSRSHSR